MSSELRDNKHFVVFGSGSAGRRHARALRSLFPEARIQIVKRSSSLQPTQQIDSEGIEIVNEPHAALGLRPDLVVIASPATMHAGDLQSALQYCQKILLEKPLAHTLGTASGKYTCNNHWLHTSIIFINDDRCIYFCATSDRINGSHYEMALFEIAAKVSVGHK